MPTGVPLLSAMWFWNWLAGPAPEREARRLLAKAFRTPELLRGTSLAPRHAGRWVLLDLEHTGKQVRRIWFGILRHPRPYSFSPQCHKVVERYLYDVEAGVITRESGINITRTEGRDAD